MSRKFKVDYNLARTTGTLYEDLCAFCDNISLIS